MQRVRQAVHVQGLFQRLTTEVGFDLPPIRQHGLDANVGRSTTQDRGFPDQALRRHTAPKLFDSTLHTCLHCEYVELELAHHAVSVDVDRALYEGKVGGRQRKLLADRPAERGPLDGFLVAEPFSPKSTRLDVLDEGPLWELPLALVRELV